MNYLLPFSVLLTCLTLLPAAAAASDPLPWFRGNTHAHTVICGHADSTPEVVTRWYHDHHYNFLILSEHNHFIDPHTVQLPANPRADFILIPGEEITGKQRIHTTAMNIDRLVPWDFDHERKSAIIQNHRDGAVAAGGQAILNHPNYRYAVAAGDVRPVQGLHLFELYNGHPGSYNFGDADHPSTEVLWDELLTAGMRIFGVASDDAHHFAKTAPNASNAGRGWVMVRAARLEPDRITAAMGAGDFYASSGVFLKSCERGPARYVVEVDDARTQAELAQSVSIRAAFVHEGSEGYQIDFIGPQGEVLSSVAGERATFDLDRSVPYVRAKVTFTRIYPEHGFEQYFAWGQPVFSDHRADRSEGE